MAWLFQNNTVKGEALRRKVKEGDLAGVMEIASESRDAMDLPDRNDGWTALMIASATGKMEIAKFLVTNGADVNMRDPNNGWTAVMCAAAKSRMELAAWLVQHGGADVMVQNNTGKTALDVIRDPAKKAALSRTAAAMRAGARGGAGARAAAAPAPAAAMPTMSAGAMAPSPTVAAGANSGVSLAGLSAAQLLAHKLASRKRAQTEATQAAQARAQAKAVAQDSITRGGSGAGGAAGMALSSSASANAPGGGMRDPTSPATQKDEQRRKLADAMLRNSVPQGPAASPLAMFKTAARATVAAGRLSARGAAAAARVPPPAPIPMGAPRPDHGARATPDPSAMASIRTSSSRSLNGEGDVQDQLKAYASSKRQDGAASQPSRSSSQSSYARDGDRGLLTLSTLGERDTGGDRKQQLQHFLSQRDSDGSDGESPLARSPSHSARGFYEPPSVTFSEPDLMGPGSEPYVPMPPLALSRSPSGRTEEAIADWVAQVRAGHTPPPPPQPRGGGMVMSSSSGAVPLPPAPPLMEPEMSPRRAAVPLSDHAISTSVGRNYIQAQARGEAEVAHAQAQAQRSSEKKKREDHYLEKEAKSSVQDWVAQMREGKFSPPPPLKHLGIDEEKIRSPLAMSPMGMGGSPAGMGMAPSGAGTLEELRGDVVALTKTVNVQTCNMEKYKNTIDEQAHTIKRLTDELMVIMGKQSRLSDEAEKMRVKELNALSIVETRVEDMKVSFERHLDSSVARLHDSLTEQVHDQMSSTAMDLLNGRDASEKALRAEIAAIKTHFSEQIEHHKQLFDQIVTAL